MQHYSLQNRTLLSHQTHTTGCCFHFGSASSFLLELFLHSFPAAYWAPNDLGVHLSVSYILSYTVHGVQRRQWHPLQCSCLENPMDRGAWWAAVHGVAKSWTWLSDFAFTFHFHALEKEMAAHSRVLAWRVPGTGEPGGLPSTGSHRVGHGWSDLAAAAAVHGVLKAGILKWFAIPSSNGSRK